MINIFQKLRANKSLIMACLQNYQKQLSLATFYALFIQTRERYPTARDKISHLT